MEYVDRERKILEDTRDDCGRCPYIVPFHECYRNGQSPYVFLLFDWIDSQLANFAYPAEGYSFKVYQRILKELALAIQYLHGKNIVHRDLKPPNILITDRDLEKASVRLADFGLSKTLRPDDRQTKGIGTPLYASPEILAGVINYGSKVDIWSYGAVAFELLAHEKLFPANTKAELMQMQEAPIPEKKSRFPRGYETVCQDFIEFCLVKEERNRPAIDAVLRHPFFDAVPHAWSGRNLIQEAETLRDMMQHFVQIVHRSPYDSSQLASIASVLCQELEHTLGVESVPLSHPSQCLVSISTRKPPQ